MCYICANDHMDQHHTVDWGFDIFSHMEPSRSDLNDDFNAGYRTLFDFEQAKCPCGAPLVGKRDATVCAACGTATCSAECHDRFVQSQNKCLFIRNFMVNEETRHIQVSGARDKGCRACETYCGSMHTGCTWTASLRARSVPRCLLFS